ncbi:MAG: zinc ribbon domain-containing protein [Armatimonadetes bacterium]|nr:zinc ribbon domain-containing protein [Armatimonadota bacterium]
MPIFEYRCNDCGRRFSALVGVVADAIPPACPKCRSENLTRLMSRFAYVRSEEAMLDSLADRAEMADPEDKDSVRKMVRDMGAAMGEDLGDDFDDYMEAAQDVEEYGYGDTPPADEMAPQ